MRAIVVEKLKGLAAEIREHAELTMTGHTSRLNMILSCANRIDAALAEASPAPVRGSSREDLITAIISGLNQCGLSSELTADYVAEFVADAVEKLIEKESQLATNATDR